MSKQTLTRATQNYIGAGYDATVYGINGRPGVPVNFLTKIDLGAPKVAVAAGIVKGATGASEAPNANTITITADTYPASPLDQAALLGTTTVNGQTVMPLDVPRNVTAAINTAVGNITVLVTGYDQYRKPMTELLAIAAAGTAVVGLKAFKYIRSVALTSDADDSGKVINVGFGSLLGLPYKLAAKSDLLSMFFDEALDVPSAVAIAVTTSPATNVTGDVRGTVAVATVGNMNGTKTLKGWMSVADPNTPEGLIGVTQA
jgi:hypothetical protein